MDRFPQNHSEHRVYHDSQLAGERCGLSIMSTQVAKLLLLVCLLAGLQGEEFATIDDALARAFPSATNTPVWQPEVDRDQAKAVLDAAQSRAKGKLGAIHIAERDGELLGLAFIDHVIGRTEYITYCCAIDAAGTVQRMEVLVYREPYGGEVRHSKWLERFTGRTREDPPRHKRSIPNITGATLSCAAMADRVNFLLVYHDLVLREQLAQRYPERASVALAQRAEVIGHSHLNLRLTAEAPNGDAILAAAISAAQAADARFNTWRADSEWSRLLSGELTHSSEQLRDAWLLCTDLHQRSNGAFDPTIRPLLEVWAEAAKQGKRPTAEELDAARAMIGLQRAFTFDAKRIVRHIDRARFDSSAILKGLIADAAAQVLREADVTGVCDYGTSSIVAIGADAEVELRTPDDQVHHITLAANQALASSGTAEQRWEIDGVAYSHLIDPVRGEPLTDARMASVIAPSATLADGLATACCVLDAEAALALVASYPDCHVWLRIGDDEHHSAGWPRAAD